MDEASLQSFEDLASSRWANTRGEFDPAAPAVPPELVARLVRAAQSAFLGVGRRTLSASVEELEELVRGYGDELGVGGEARLAYSDRRGYHMTVPASCRDRILASAAAPGSVSLLVLSAVSESDAKRREADPNRRSSAEDADASAAERCCSARAAARSRRLFFSEPRDAASPRLSLIPI